MLTRRDFLHLAGLAGFSLALPGCAASPPLRKDIFPEFGDPVHPYLGLATSLREEHDYEARVEGAVPPELQGALYRIGPGLFDRGGLRRRTVLDGDGMVQSFTFHAGGVRYRNRFVRTRRYVAEEAAGAEGSLTADEAAILTQYAEEILRRQASRSRENAGLALDLRSMRC